MASPAKPASASGSVQSHSRQPRPWDSHFTTMRVCPFASLVFALSQRLTSSCKQQGLLL